MNILATQYSLANRAYEIYVAGCKGNPHCKGCHNPESWDFTNGELCTEQFAYDICCKIYKFDDLVDKIFIFGGEPLDQDLDELYLLTSYLKYKLDKEIWVFTRYDSDEVLDKLDWRLNVIDYVKCGGYDCNKLTDDNIQYGIKLASSNQYIVNVKEDL